MCKRFPWLAVGVVAATYVYFLIFAEFAFLSLVQATVESAGEVKRVMAGLGTGGVAGSVLAAVTYVRTGWRRRLAVWFCACALAAVLAAGWSGPWPAWCGLGVLIGVSLGGLTVTLATGLRMASGVRLGWVCGLGTGLAYAFCNVPVVFAAAADVQCMVAAVVALAGVGLAWCLPVESSDEAQTETTNKGWWHWLVILGVLVWMDSAAFAVIQHESGLREATWNSPSHLWAYALLHLVAAIWAGWALRLGFARCVSATAWLLLAGSCMVLASSGGALAGPASWPYVAAVSLYSAVLVYVPASTGKPWVATAVYAVSGWVGSALGIGMAQDLTVIPAWFAPVSGVVVLVVLYRPTRVVQPLLMLGLALVSLLQMARGDEIEKGREVYISEGCIHCHSQYVRPGTKDVEWWGPVVPLRESLKEAPPLYGNRRQGPDLVNVGLRRSAEWNRLHLINPRAVSSGSRMPAYGYLFSGDGSRGEALLAYLESLGRDRLDARMELVAGWSPLVTRDDVLRVDAKQLFAGACVQCHGLSGRGDGVLAGQLTVPPPDFTAGWRRPLQGETEVARVIKFGLPGTAMAGHETLDDAELVSLARLVISLHPVSSTP